MGEIIIIIYINCGPLEFSVVNKIKRNSWKRKSFFSKLNREKGGPMVVAKNLLKELDMRKDIYWDLCYRDIPENKSINVMWVVNDVTDLQWAIANKKKVGAKELWAGPNLVVVPQESEGILNHKEIDKIIVPCEWVKEVYESESHELTGKVDIWPVGVDTDFWHLSNLEKKSKEKEGASILVYNKKQDDLCNKIIPIIEHYGKVKTINYGEYNVKEYKQALNDTTFMVWLSLSESQGIALLEALSMDIPILAWDPGYWLYYSKELKREFVCYNASSSPYFSSQCGVKFKSLEDFENKFNEFEYKMGKLEFKPRSYLLKNNLIIGETLRNLQI